MAKYGLFGLAVIAMVALWGALQFHASGPDDWVDDVLVVEIAITFGIAALVQFIWTPEWTARVIGVFFTTLGTAVLFGGAMWTRLIADPPARTPEWVIDLARSFYLVGGPLLAYGVLIYTVDRVRDRRAPAPSQRESLERTAEAAERTATATERIADEPGQERQQGVIE